MEQLRKRWKYYLIVYVCGYIISLIGTGIPNIYYLMPIKVFPFCMTLIIGHAIYYGLGEKIDRFTATFKSLKYVLLCVIILMISAILKGYLLKNYGIDISPFIGFE